MKTGNAGSGWIKPSGGWAAVIAIALAAGFSGRGVADEPVIDSTAEIREAATAYAKAFNTSDYVSLADQWAERALLVEGGLELEGRAEIMASLRSWREQHPAASMEIEVGLVDLVAEPLARVEGILRFTPKPGAQPVISRFSSLRVREGKVWRLVESIIVPEHAAALEDLAWLVGTWNAETTRAEDGSKTTVETIYEKPLGPYCLVGRSRIRPPAGEVIEALEVIHADRSTGAVRCWVFDSTGARGEGTIESDGTTFFKTMVGTPADRVPGMVARWTQVISPTGDGRCTLHSIERSIDNQPLPDGEPLHFRKIR